MRYTIALMVCIAFLGMPLSAQTPSASLRPPERVGVETRSQNIGTALGFQSWLAGFRQRATDAGISQQVLDNAISSLSYDEAVIRRDRNQAEFTKTIWDYLDTAVSDLRVANGKASLNKWGKTLSRIETAYGVEAEVIVAIWGLESAYGTFRGSGSVLNSLATLAYDARRAAFFEGQFLDALRILQAGDTTRSSMLGSWAGAMGHTQFMPSSFHAHAVDWDRDGKRDIWGDDPVDALASTAAYLENFGWRQGQPWGIEVQLPTDFDYALARRSLRKLPSDWAALGVTDLNGRAVPDHGLASVLLPGGAEGARFLIFGNFEVLEHYNTADAYVIGVGHLSDRIKGGAPIRGSWPRHLRALTYEERVELQERLTAAGFDTEKIDAKMGPLTINAVRRFQVDQGVVPDGYPSLSVLDRLRAL